MDCTELLIERPSSQIAQWQTSSEYKHHNRLTLLVGVTPNGRVTFVSRLCEGPFLKEGILARIDRGMFVMADKGFTINDLLSDPVQLNVHQRYHPLAQHRIKYLKLHT